MAKSTTYLSKIRNTLAQASMQLSCAALLEKKSTTEKQRSDIKAAITKAVNIIDRIVWKTYDK